MKKRMYTVWIGGLLSGVTMLAQSPWQPATEAQKAELIEKVKQTAAEMKTMTCDFTQVKELSFMDEKITAEGKMNYKQPDKIRWEYTKPYTFVFATDGKNIFTGTGNSSNKMPVKSSKLFSAIADIMIGGVSGSGLVDSPDFTTQVESSKNEYRVTLTPLKKEIKDLFSAVQLHIRRTDYRIYKVELIEKSDDKTSIELKNIQLNTTIRDEIFSH
jgi:outer membrane lipoprotein-sorting protein